MVDIAPPAVTPVAGNVLFYSKPEPLNSEAHAKIGLRRIAKPYGFASVSHVAPLTVAEFPAAAIVYPIIFAGDKYQPLAVMGLNQTQNMFIREDGMFELGAYIPVYIRRYPFVLAADEPRERMVVCIDRAARMIGELPDFALFDAAGEPTGIHQEFDPVLQRLRGGGAPHRVVHQYPQRARPVRDADGDLHPGEPRWHSGRPATDRRGIFRGVGSETPRPA